MSEKIVITQEQDERIKLESKNGDAEYKALTLDCHINGWGAPLNQCLKSLSTSDMARILYEPNSYEVKPKFEIGDIVAGKNDIGVYKILRFKCEQTAEGVYVKDNKPTHLNLVFLRHATKEEIFWAELGREVGEFVEGDARLNSEGVIIRVTDKELAKRHYEKGNLKGFYPASSYIQLP